MKTKSKLLFFTLLLLTLNINAKNIKSGIIKANEFPGLNQSDDVTVFMGNFYKWYKTKFDYLDHTLHFVDTQNSGLYRINFRETERYLSILKSSGFFSDNYINNYRGYFKKIDLNLQKIRQNDGAVDGLDYDFIMHSQEPESLLDDLNAIQLSVVKPSLINVVVKMKTKYNHNTYQFFYLIKKNDRYLIDKIDFINNNKS